MLPADDSNGQRPNIIHWLSVARQQKWTFTQPCDYRWQINFLHYNWPETVSVVSFAIPDSFVMPKFPRELPTVLRTHFFSDIAFWNAGERHVEIAYRASRPTCATFDWRGRSGRSWWTRRSSGSAARTATRSTWSRARSWTWWWMVVILHCLSITRSVGLSDAWFQFSLLTYTTCLGWMAAVVLPTSPKALAEQMSRNIRKTQMNECSTYGVVF